jgi:hypothetical protein
MPKTATRSPGSTSATLIALHVVTPAHVSGAASNEVTPSGTGTTYEASATVYSVNAPSIEYPLFCWDWHNVSRPSMQ